MEIGLESIYLRNIKVAKIEFLRVKQPQYLAECHKFITYLKCRLYILVCSRASSVALLKLLDHY